MFKVLWACLALPSWTILESKLPETPPPIYSSAGDAPDDMPILFRDKDGLSPQAQQMWLALEMKDVEYSTVLLLEDDDDDDDDSPKLQWPDGSIQTNVMEVLERIEEEYSDRPPELYKRISQAVDNVRCNMMRFDPVFPRYTEPTRHAPYIFRDGGLTSRDSHMVSLEEVDEVLEEYDDGPFFCGDFVSAADIYWAPFLERYVAQLPLTYDGDMLEPRYGGRYEAIDDWFKAMESTIPCYACRIAGDSVTWENVLREAVDKKLVPGVELLPSRGRRVPKSRTGKLATQLWNQYREKRSYLCKTPAEECVAFLVRNRETLIADASIRLKQLQGTEIDEALRETIGTLLGKSEASKMSGNARDVAAFLDDHIRAPRDMGMLPAATLRALAKVAPKPRIKA
jgi:glutathione S-transferase